MRRSSLAIVDLSEDELAAYTARQIDNFFPDGRNANNLMTLSSHLQDALDRLAPIADVAMHWQQGKLDPLSSPQYAQYLYVIANVVWKSTGDERLPTKLFLLNKALHGIDLFFKVEMPPIFLIGHAVGTVLGHASYGNYFVAFQNTTVGRVGDQVPIIGKGVLMFPHSAIVGRCSVGDFTVLGQGASLINRDTPGDVTILGRGADLHEKAGRSGVFRHYFRNVDFL